MSNALSKHVTLVAAGLFVALYSPGARAQCVAAEGGESIACFTLFAGQTIDAGNVCFEVVGENLDVTYFTTGGWELEEAHLWVGTGIGDMPQTRKGNPIPGQFPYASGDITGETEYAFSIPLADLLFDCGGQNPSPDTVYLAAAHAALRRDNGAGGYQTETGWSDGSPIASRGGWATFSSLTLSCDCGGGGGGEGGDGCETAFGFDSAAGTCFLDIDEDGDGRGDFNRWGWTNGDYYDGTYTMEIYAGAGQCDTGKGTYVGDLTVTYSGGVARATYDLEPPYTMIEAHFYAGSEILARNDGEFTVAPGQYPVVDENLGDAHSHTSSPISGLSGPVYFVAHATVCGF